MMAAGAEGADMPDDMKPRIRGRLQFTRISSFYQTLRREDVGRALERADHEGPNLTGMNFRRPPHVRASCRTSVASRSAHLPRHEEEHRLKKAW